ncbi:MAG: PaaI family thioesterase [Maricaulaceae bacterium]|jgi:uncharacterized protein (TIGR00369 family)
MERDKSDYGVTPPGVARELSGREFLQAIAEGRLPAAPITQHLPFQLAAVGDGFAVFEGQPDEGVYNPFGSVHGGFAMTMLDSALACAVQSTLPKGLVCSTLETKVNMIAAMTRKTGRVRAEGHVVHVGRTTGVAAGSLTDNRGKVLAHATSTCLIFPIED